VTVFLIIGGVLLAVTMVVLLVPLLAHRAETEAPAAADSATVYRDQLAELDAERDAGRLTQEQWAAAAAEIDRRVLEDHRQAEATAAAAARSPIAAILVAVSLPITAAALYLVLGSPQALSPTSGATASANHEITREQIEGMVAKLAARMATSPEDVEGWVMLARSYGALERYAEAAEAYARATNQRPNDAQLLADHADMLALARGRDLRGEPEALIARALKADPDHVKALALAGTAAFQRSDYAGALTAWRRALQLLPPESPIHGSLRDAVADAEKKLAAPAAAAPGPVASAAASVRGRVELPAALAAQRKPDDTVFVFARAAEGPRAPLAVMRKTVKELPLQFTLDDSMAMAPNLKLSQFDRVVVVARISAAGSPTAQKGDLEAVSAPLAPGSGEVVLNQFRALD